ncbi:hypothetical protein GRAQ_01719 [Rahnella aquatilis CIP 78.65 = ATCC 33071]|uniref:Uncharacterized protein n=1 Tax=Rahnella aquatilis (strain ATCC 33071 / DSM 4594 / JCM 1683 / NBRC 105701 / NCIMB 13365 / CIP 78.65) TaxID=745277 RepID=H2IRL6_RAHAC|nr:hypothetical protein [Rahnella aquatilis]AEX52517.1 hypothetical protein Rahaq2_2671 [Rahnella aquatilis CIP 78.65 = ATCC 33071]KFD06740.1 hypothetical protein GRAQ_01719 [Rahnella aquatilis CIP 78.65 = ATCC 33071]
MNPELNLACNIRILESNEKYKYIASYLFFYSLLISIRQNHEKLICDLSDLQDLNFKTDKTNILDKKVRVQNSLLNLLNSHKFFIDILEREYKKTEPKMYRRFKTVAAYHYDNDFNYRMFEALRNYCQHANIIPMDIFSNFEGMSYIFINKQELGKDIKIKKKIKGEIDSPHPIELNSIVVEWTDTASHIHELVLDYFAYKAKPVVDDYLGQLGMNTLSISSDPDVMEALRSVELKIIKKNILFPVLPDPRIAVNSIHERLKTSEHVERYLRMQKIYLSNRSAKNSKRHLSKLGADFEFPRFDTLFFKNINKWLNGEDPF